MPGGIGMNYYDRQGNPISQEKCMELWSPSSPGSREYKRVAETTLADGRNISTAWLGLDHNFGDGPPMIFETMIFPEAKVYERYITEEGARRGHARAVEQCERERAQGKS